MKVMNLYFECRDEFIEVELRTHKEICPRCLGNGRHDAWTGGMTRDEIDEMGPDFFDDYMGGMYSVTCTECNGKNVVDVIDREHLTPEVRKALDQWEKDESDYRAEQRAERLAGC